MHFISEKHYHYEIYTSPWSKNIFQLQLLLRTVVQNKTKII